MCEESSMSAEQKERYIRWQDYRINQLSFSINLFLGFAVASLAFAVNIKLENKPLGILPIEPVILCWAYCTGVGCIATISRLLDFRYTTRKIKDGGAFNAFMAKYCGPVTWGFFWGEVLTYAIGGCLFITSVFTA